MKAAQEPKQDKVQAIEALVQTFQKSKSTVLTGFSGLTVEEVTQLRMQLSKQKVEYQVVKNNLARLALNRVNVMDLDDLFTGPTAIAFSMDDALASARILSKFSKDHEKLSIKGGWMSGKKLTSQDVKALALLPSREVLIAQLLGSLQSPIQGLTVVLSGVLRKFVIALNEVAKQKK